MKELSNERFKLFSGLRERMFYCHLVIDATMEEELVILSMKVTRFSAEKYSWGTDVGNVFNSGCRVPGFATWEETKGIMHTGCRVDARLNGSNNKGLDESAHVVTTVTYVKIQ
jgi:hypothetical protein